ncbi:hypothetical protein LCI18_011769 [Fusarium solani-melongenae]|uniref:Uncharacterized protein n=1 Tax=Fusarium solani subsp. cucurbitae TaxID=2747967 RepID=A0ACD3ZHS1_FUSSC|nr:hypothetical protein LCI18_011769 [Fusarium solani-melongenae]
MGDVTEQDLMDMAVMKNMRHSQGDDASPKDRPLQDHLIDIISEDWGHRDREEIGKFHGEIFGTIMKAGKPLFSQLATSQQPPRPEHPTLHQLLLAKMLYFRLEADTSPASLVPIHHSEGYSVDVLLNMVLDPTFEKELDIYGPIPWYTPEGIVTIIAVVCVDGRDISCKSQSEPSRLRDGLEARELKCSIRVPQLLGCIHDKDTKKILGFVRQWVPGWNLFEIDLSATSAETKQKWASQIRETVQLLHELGIAWADPNPFYVIIDERDDAWLIEVGDELEEFRPGMEFMDTTERYDQDLDMIEKFLGGDENVFP